MQFLLSSCSMSDTIPHCLQKCENKSSLFFPVNFCEMFLTEIDTIAYEMFSSVKRFNGSSVHFFAVVRSLFNGRPSPPASEKVVNELPTFRVSPEQTGKFNSHSLQRKTKRKHKIEYNNTLTSACFFGVCWQAGIYLQMRE